MKHRRKVLRYYNFVFLPLAPLSSSLVSSKMSSSASLHSSPTSSFQLAPAPQVQVGVVTSWADGDKQKLRVFSIAQQLYVCLSVCPFVHATYKIIFLCVCLFVFGYMPMTNSHKKVFLYFVCFGTLKPDHTNLDQTKLNWMEPNLTKSILSQTKQKFTKPILLTNYFYNELHSNIIQFFLSFISMKS